MGLSSFFRPIDEPTRALRALATHLTARACEEISIPSDTGLGTHGKAVIGYKIDGVPIPFAVVHCPSEISAERRLQSSPREWLAQRNGPLVIHFDMWSDDAKASRRKVRKLLREFERQFEDE